MAISNSTPAPKSFFTLAMTDAIKAAVNVESAFYRVALSLAGLNAAKQVEAIIGGGEIDEKRIKNTWNVFCMHHAKAGNVVWTGTENAVTAIKIARGAAKDDAARNYIFKKAKGSRLVPGLERAKRVVSELVKDMLTNHADTIHSLAIMERDGIAGETVHAAFETFIRENYPATFGGLVEQFRKPSKPRPDTSEFQKAWEHAQKIEDVVELAAFVTKVQERLSMLQADKAEAEAALDVEEAEAEETFAPVLLKTGT